MEYTEDFLKKLTQVGTLGYPLSKIINVLDIEDEKKFKKDFYDLNHVAHKSYQKGVDKADFILDSKLFEMAKNGDLNALKKFETRKRDQLFTADMEKRKNEK